MRQRRKLLSALAVLGLGGVIATGPTGSVGASSHREAPLISQDPVADLTDVYAFNSPDDPNSVTFIMDVVPFENPAGGPNFYKFGDDVAYQFNIDSNGDSIADFEYQFRFNSKIDDYGSYLYNNGPVTSQDDENLNVEQRYTVTETQRYGWHTKSRALGKNLPVPPANVGPRSTPNYEANLGSKGVVKVSDGIKTFAGPRDDPFFADLGAIFDLGGLRPLNGAHAIPLPTEKGRDDLAGYNVHSIAIQIPKSRLVRDGDPVLGVWATTQRQSVTVRNNKGQKWDKGPWVQVSRLGNPLVNEVVVPLGKKDAFNGSHPYWDLQFAGPVLKPELGALIPILYPGVTVPTNVDAGLGLGGREDLATIFLTGIPGVNKPKTVRPAEMLRLNTSSAKSAFPDGRWLADDVVDTSLRAVAGATAFTPEFDKSPNNILGDGVDANDKAFTGSFPYLAAPADGYSKQ